MLFHPDLIGEECEGLHEALVYSIQKSDLDVRKKLYQSIVLAGGSTLLSVSEKKNVNQMVFYGLYFYFQGFGDRLLSEIKKLAPKNMKLKVKTQNF